MVQLEEEKYDINYVVSSKDSEVWHLKGIISIVSQCRRIQINEMSIAVNDLRGKL
jgi:hypothetical protein